MLERLNSLPSGAVSLLLLAAIPVVLRLAYQALYYRRVKEFERLPQLKPSLIWGHLKAMGELARKGEPDCDGDELLKMMFRMLGKPPIMVLDLRPLTQPMVVVCSHDVAEQISRSSKAFPWSLPKSPTMAGLHPLVGRHSVLMLEGEEWKSLRRRFNPGFSPQHLMTLLPCILDKTQVFLRHLDGFCASGEEFCLEPFTINLTFDIIGKIIMDVDFGAQESKERKTEMISTYSKLLGSFSEKNGLVSIPGPLKRWNRYRYGRRVDQILRQIVIKRFEELKEQRRHETVGANGHAGKDESASATAAMRNITSLSLQDVDELDEFTLQSTCDQVKTFLLAGHDTTAILLEWAFYELSRSPDVKARLVAELDDIFGPDPDPDVVRAKLLDGGEDLVRRMSYTSAIIKELLRLHPPAGSVRLPPLGSNFNVRLPDGKEVCLDGLVLYNCAGIIQRDESVYGEHADVFMPERWLGNTDTSMATNDAAGDEGGASRKAVPPGAWRPFERGPRNCIGQELANIEARVILACCVRRYDFVKVGIGELALDAEGRPSRNEVGQYKVKSEMYAKRQVTSKPVDGMRCTVHLSDRAKAAAAKSKT